MRKYVLHQLSLWQFIKTVWLELWWCIIQFSRLIVARREIKKKKMTFSSSGPLWSASRVIGFWRCDLLCLCVAIWKCVISVTFCAFSFICLQVSNTCLLCFCAALLYKPIDRVTRSTLVLHVSRAFFFSIPLFPSAGHVTLLHCESHLHVNFTAVRAYTHTLVHWYTQPHLCPVLSAKEWAKIH